jgi:mannose-6-phosphate isomerase-like protein (cupin superfamily)
MQTFELASLKAEQSRADRPYLEFLRIPALSMGLYHLRAGTADLQRPHTEDEAYYVLAGRARFRCGSQQVEVQPGTVLFVEKAAEHRFFDITEDLTLLVFFAPAEGLESSAVTETP